MITPEKGALFIPRLSCRSNAPPEFQDRSILWNSVEMVEKTRDAQLAREMEISLPVELNREEQLRLARSFISDTFVAAGMCANFSIHDKKDGNPHFHVMLTIRPLKEDGQWGAKCWKVYELEENGQRIPNSKGGWKNHRKDTTDWNDKGNVEKWRAAWDAYANKALEAASRPERIDHRSYERQGIDKIPSIHLRVAASQMERKGIATERGSINRQIVADIQLLIGQSSSEGERKKKARMRLKRQNLLPSGGTDICPSYGRVDKCPPILEYRDKEIRDKSIENKGDMTHAYGRYRNVFLSSAELAELQTELPSLWEQYIERLFEYMESSGKGYKNHVATIRRWANADKKRGTACS